MVSPDAEAQELLTVVKQRQWPATFSEQEKREALGYIDLLDAAFNQVLSPHLRNPLLHAIRKLCQKSGCLPPTLDLPVLPPLGTVPFCSSTISDIYKSIWDGKDVALKVLRIHANEQEKLRKALLSEAAIWRALRHQNIAPFFGVSTGHPACFVSEWMAHGTIINYLQEQPNANQHAMIRQINSGLLYLHAVGLVHGNIKSANILVNDQGEACLTDFGLTVALYHNQNFNRDFTNTNTLRYMAPELLREDEGLLGQPSIASDIYSLATVVWEIFSGQRPYNEWASHRDWVLVSRVLEGVRPKRPHGSLAQTLTNGIWKWVKRAWSDEPGRRPSLEDLNICVDIAETEIDITSDISSNDSPSTSTAAEPMSHKKEFATKQTTARMEDTVPIIRRGALTQPGVGLYTDIQSISPYFPPHSLLEAIPGRASFVNTAEATRSTHQDRLIMEQVLPLGVISAIQGFSTSTSTAQSPAPLISTNSQRRGPAEDEVSNCLYSGSHHLLTDSSARKRESILAEEVVPSCASSYAESDESEMDEQTQREAFERAQAQDVFSHTPSGMDRLFVGRENLITIGSPNAPLASQYRPILPPNGRPLANEMPRLIGTQPVLALLNTHAAVPSSAERLVEPHVAQDLTSKAGGGTSTDRHALQAPNVIANPNGPDSKGAASASKEYTDINLGNSKQGRRQTRLWADLRRKWLCM